MDSDWHYDELRGRLNGPVYPIPPAFSKDGSLDIEATKAYVQYLVKHGANILMVTAGTSRLNILSIEEVDDLNAAVAAASGGSMVIAGAAPYGGVATAVESSQKAQASGADAILLFYPDRYYDDTHVFKYYETVAASTSLGIMAHGVGIPNGIGGGVTPYSYELCKKLITLPAFIGMKEEFENEALRYKLASKLGVDMPLVVAGASMRKFLSCNNFGVNSWLVGVGSFLPEIEESFFKSFKAGRLEEAMGIVSDIENTFFEAAFPIGWHLAMRTTLGLMGLMPPHERAPLPNANPKDIKQLTETISRLGWKLEEA